MKNTINKYALSNYEMALHVLEQKGEVKSGYNTAYVPHYGCKGTYFGSPLSVVRIEVKTLEKLVENGLAEMVLGRRSTRRYYQRKVVAI